MAENKSTPTSEQRLIDLIERLKAKHSRASEAEIKFLFRELVS
jgi:hypothetical protein